MAFVNVGAVGSGVRTKVSVESRAGTSRRSYDRRISLARMVDLNPQPQAGNVDASRDDLLLAELRFSDPSRLPNIINFRKDDMDDAFFAFVDKKIAAEADLEEKENLSILKEAVLELIGKVQASVEAAETVEAPVLTREESFEKLRDDILNFPEGVAMGVEKYYSGMTQEFLALLTAQAETSPKAKEVLEAVYNKMNLVMASAQDNLLSALKSPNPGALVEKLESLHADNKLDDSFMLLLAGNLEQAKKAGVENAVQALQEVQKQAMSILDESVTPELRLVRKLLREPNVDARSALITEAFKSKGSFILDDETETSAGSAVDAKKFVQTMSDLMKNFGNMEEGFQQNLKRIAAEAEEIAKDLYGYKEKDIKELQDEAFEKRTVSVWELEQMEMQSEMQGQDTPWENPRAAGFDDTGKRIV
ncbi:hypothetical protein NDN08_001107 [Rhodosorus marinus]|uniref:Uncharacterized protein n=1 Tax=Rhodosorus marinus TaxID=101924 RepID=A0AAV8UQ34_9RHOD|nr:hypothetical protein NDN08_001107 [Rhodosorus marinus]